MEDEEYRMQIACKQVYTILNLYNRELLCLILPEEVLRKLKENSAKDYEYNINPNTFSPDDITEEASAILKTMKILTIIYYLKIKREIIIIRLIVVI